VFYMAIPPSMFPTVAQSLASVGPQRARRIVVEKPFGRDLQSARELNATLHSIFPEDRIFRIDHYLGKESVEDLLVFRFSNAMIEPVWNRNYVRSVQITMSETIGVEGRGSFYDSVGAIRDVMQNHLLQVLALVAMEPPSGRRRVPAGREGEGLRGDAPARPEEPRARPVRRLPQRAGVDADSHDETFAAARLEIDSWRWAGVPWYVRCGKALAARRPRSSSSSATRRACCSTRPAVRAAPQPRPLPARQERRRDVHAPGEDAGPAPRQPERRRRGRLRARSASARGVRAALDDAIAGSPRRFAARTSSSRRGASCSPRSINPGAGAPVLPRLVGPSRGRPHPLRRPLEFDASAG
jgi:hypothetical protein